MVKNTAKATSPAEDRVEVIQNLKGEADRKRQATQLESALELYSQALDYLKETPSLQESSVGFILHSDLLGARAECERFIGDYMAAAEDYSNLASLAKRAGDNEKQAGALIRRAALLSLMGDPACGQEAEDALALARQVGGPNLAAQGLITLGDALSRLSEYAHAQSPLEEAITLSIRVPHWLQ